MCCIEPLLTHMQVRPRQGDSNSNEPTTSTTFQPEFTYPIFGDHETAFGYKDLSLKVY